MITSKDTMSESRITNEMSVQFPSDSANEAFARVVVSAFVTQTNPTFEEVADIKTAVSEAVTNSIIHGYEKQKGTIEIRVRLENKDVYIEIEDHGVGIADVQKAMEPLYTTKSNEERSGMGFSFMEAFMDELAVESVLGSGTIVKMHKVIGR